MLLYPLVLSQLLEGESVLAIIPLLILVANAHDNGWVCCTPLLQQPAVVVNPAHLTSGQLTLLSTGT
jgi:hypothetical protein